MTGYRTGVEDRAPEVEDEPPVCMKGRGLGMALWVWASCDICLDDDGDLLTCGAFPLSAMAPDSDWLIGVASLGTPVTLLGVESSGLSPTARCRSDCTSLAASPVAGVGAMEELGPD